MSTSRLGGPICFPRGCAAYVNYLGEVEEEGIRAAYGQKYERLSVLKEKYDPTNFFCVNQNIKPSGAGAASQIEALPAPSHPADSFLKSRYAFLGVGVLALVGIT